MNRAILGFFMVVGLAVGFGSIDAAAQGGGTVTSLPDVVPAIWLKRSPTVDPTRLPLGNGRMVVDAPRKGYVFACDPLM